MLYSLVEDTCMFFFFVLTIACGKSKAIEAASAVIIISAAVNVASF